MKKVLLPIIGIAILAVVAILAYTLTTAVKEGKEAVGVVSGDVVSSPKKKELTALPVPEKEADIYDNLDYAISKNKDTVAWLEVPNTDINNVVMQGDDNDFYLRRNENKEQDVYGCYFLDYECSIGRHEDFSKNTIIYGHNELTDNPDGKRFAQLYRFLEDDFAEQTKSIFVTTSDGRFEFEVISVFYTDLTFAYTKVNMTDEEALELEKKAISLSERDYGVTPKLGDKLLTLSTCTEKFPDPDNYRYVVMGRLIEEKL